MLPYLSGRLLQAFLTVVILITILFFAVRLTPGEPVELLLPEEASPEQIARVREAWGLDDPLPVQFLAYATNVVQGDLGVSRIYDRPVLDVILERLPATLLLAGAALALALLVAVPLGVLSSLRPGSAFDVAVSSVALAIQSVPSFFLGVQLILLVSVRLELLPPSGSGGLKYLILPALTLSADSLALMVRVIRTEMTRVMRQDYIRVAYAKGLSSRRVITMHAFRNAANPLVTLTGLRLGALLGGAVITETIFAWPGVGRLVIQSVLGRDYALIQGIVLIAALVFVMLNIIVDLIYSLLDPRIRYARS